MIIWNSKMETKDGSSVQFSSVQSLSRVRLFVTPWTAACQSSLFFTISQSLLKLMLVMPCNHLILCHPLLLLPSIVPSIRIFSDESVLRIRWPKDWSSSTGLFKKNYPLATWDPESETKRFQTNFTSE